MRSLPSLAISRPVTTLMVAVACIALGVAAWQRIPLDFVPELERPQLSIMVPYPNALPEEVERRVIEPVEGELRTVPGVHSVTATAHRNSAQFRVQFDWETHMRVAYLDVREHFEALRRTLPREAQDYFIWKNSAGEIPIAIIALGWEGNIDEFHRALDHRIKPAIDRVPGVAIVNAWGQENARIYIDLDQERLAAHSIDPYLLIDRLQKFHISESAGSIGSGGRQMLVRTVDTYHTPEDVRRIRIGKGDLQLRDVARVTYGYPEREFIGRLNGKPAVSMSVQKESDANTVATADAVMAALEDIEADEEFSGLSHRVFLNQGEEIRKAAGALQQAGAWGAGLATVVLLAFLRRWRMTLLIAVAIPISLLIAIMILYFLGRSLNIITMLGLMLAVGALVDNSVVVVENIVRLRQEGLDPSTAAARGATEVALAILASTATTIVVFFPLFFLEGGEVRVYLRELGLAMGLSLLASLVVALTIVPLAAQRLLADRVPSPPRSSQWFSSAYTTTLRGALHHPWVTIGITLAVLTLTVIIPISAIQSRGRPESTQRQARINMRTDFDPTNITRTEKLFTTVETLLEEQRDALEIDSYYSFSGQRNDHPQMYVSFLEPPESTTPVATLIDRLKAALPDLPEAQLAVGRFDESSDTHNFNISLRGESYTVIDHLIQTLSGTLRSHEWVARVQVGQGRTSDELQLRIDRDRAGALGLSPQSVGRSVAFALRGTQLPSLQTPDGEVPIWVQLEPQDRRDQQQLGNLRVVSAEGNSIALQTVGRFAPKESPRRIRRKDGRRTEYMTVTTRDVPVSEANQRIRTAIGDLSLPPGYEVDFGQRLQDYGINQQAIRTAGVLGIVMIYLVLASLFESFAWPFLILLSVPFAMIGTSWVMYLSGTPMDYAAFVGIVLLIGIVANNAIVIVDRINQLRATGLSVEEAVIRGGLQRLRPVFMTAFTTVLGLIPLAIGDASIFGREVMFSPMGRAVIGGLLTSTLLVLILVPFGYVLLARLQEWFAAVWYAAKDTPRSLSAPEQPIY